MRTSPSRLLIQEQHSRDGTKFQCQHIADATTTTACSSSSSHNCPRRSLVSRDPLASILSLFSRESLWLRCCCCSSISYIAPCSGPLLCLDPPYRHGSRAAVVLSIHPGSHERIISIAFSLACFLLLLLAVVAAVVVVHGLLICLKGACITHTHTQTECLVETKNYPQGTQRKQRS